MSYFQEKVRGEQDTRFRHTFCGSLAIEESKGTVIIYGTRFSVAAGHTIASRLLTYSFNTNGALTAVSSRWEFPAFDF